MTAREKILATLHGDRAEKLPFFHWWRHSQIGKAERECRNRGMGMCWSRPSHIMTMHNVDRTERQDVSTGVVVQRRIYRTPVGTIYLDEKRERGVEQWHALRSWRDVSPWQIHRLIKEPQDYDVLKYMVEHTEYKPYYFPIEQAKEWLGDDGIVIAGLPHSPMQMLMIDWVGSEGGRFYIHHAKYRDKVEELYEAISKSYEAMYEIAAKSPADMVMFGDNIDGVLVNPRLYEKYFMPEYEKCAKILHEHNKIMATHMDGRVGILKDLIAKSPQDVIEALHPPPMGDLPISDALSLWKDKVIWMGYPGSVYVLGSEAVKKHALSLLRTIVPGDRLCVEMSTENLVSNKNLLTLTSVLENAELPLTDEKIDRIEKDLL
jgi:hypothetical protein